MAKTRTLNPLTEQPTKLTDLTKDFMFCYAKSPLATQSDVDFIVNLFEKNKITKANPLTGKEIDGFNMPVIRKEFATKYYPNLIKTKKSIVDELKEIKK